jgi:dTDP-4-dehydrorhamnose reductase
MRIAVTGANGQLGQALCARLTRDYEVLPFNQPDFELTTPEAVGQLVVRHPNMVIHAAAYTDVDGCARDPQRAYRVNSLGTWYVALACQQLDIPLVYISTNEVFDGTSSTPYYEYDQPAPINAYARSKWMGEQALRQLVQRFYIVRVAWLFGGKRNFVRTVLRLASNPPAGGLRMVADEVGNPTYAEDAADALVQLIQQPFYGIYHLTNSGACSRYEFAQQVLRCAGADHITMTPIALADYQRDSTPPPFTPLANEAGAALGITLRPWQEAVASYVGTLQAEQAP